MQLKEIIGSNSVFMDSVFSILGNGRKGKSNPNA